MISIHLILLVALGGALGSVARYLTAILLNPKTNLLAWPWSTFAVNLIGCLLIGLLGGFWTKNPVAPEWRLLLITGFLGGFTTFSSFALESLTLFQTKPLLMFSYIAASTLFGITLAALGFWIASR